MDKESLSVDDFYIYKDSASWGKFSEAKKNKITFESDGWKFNVPTGSIGLFAIDNTNLIKTSSIVSENPASENELVTLSRVSTTS